MPIRPLSVTYTCSACGWSKTVTPRSDALMPGDIVNSCQSCGHAPLDRRKANAVESAAGIVAEKFKTLLR